MISKTENNLLILGAGGHGRVLADAAESMNVWNEIVFLDDRYPEINCSGPWKVVGKISEANNFKKRFNAAAVGIGANKVRMKMINELLELGFQLPVIAHSSAVISKYSKVGIGSVIFANAVINIGSDLGQGCIVNTSAVVEHDCKISEGVHLSPGVKLAGAVVIGSNCWIGIGTAIKESMKIGKNVRIGANAAVVKNIPDDVTAVGVPAKIMKRNNNE